MYKTYTHQVTALNDTEHQALKVQINDAKHAKEFSTLLNSIVNVNKERYDTLKRMSRLQQFPSYPPRQTLRGGESEDSSEDDDDGSGPEIVAYLVLPQQEPVESDESDDNDDTIGIAPLRPIMGLLNNSSLSEAEDETLRTDYIENTLRSCHKRGFKRCDSSSESGEMETGTYPRTRSKLKKDKKKKRGAMKQKMNEKETLQVETLASSESKKCIKACKKAEAQSLRASHKSEDTETEEETEKDVSKEKHTEKPSQLSVKDEIPIKGKNISDDDKLRDSLRSCTSKTIKRCKRACKKAKNEVCSVYACKRKMKTKFNKQCKKSCREEFKRERHGGSSIYSSDEDW
ncbi:hypothetical protein MSG28_015544 [Choristoneura fumiferana]|uniref:Uncharacterized protein n=1 Tax=Choristoneura fumiferana TaxID=7141 RepID=A0ACC0KAL7_CHOFU|nr:hypothetical protein MSG28_015544 [Choristoneura fumiferana]